MRRTPVPRRDVYALYWRFASERQRAFERRVNGYRPPWTDDPILRRFKFCNVYRAADRISQYLIKEIAYNPEVSTQTDRIFQIVAFRLFSKIETWQAISRHLGHLPTIDDLRTNAFRAAVEHAKRENGLLYTGAFILCATNAYGQRAKYLNHIELLRHMFVKDSVADRLLGASSLKDVYDILHEYPLLGDFMAYQMAIDVNYSDLISFSENDFTKPGPGALRGMRKAFLDLGDYSLSDVVMWMVERQEDEFRARELPFGGLWGRPLHAIDCQGLFCEVDKYCREAMPDLKSARTRIKARFSPSREGFRLFFPPKWGINDRLPAREVFGTSDVALYRVDQSTTSAATGGQLALLRSD